MKRWAIARTRGHCNGWTIEAFRSGSGTWWVTVYDAIGSGGEAGVSQKGTTCPELLKQYPTIDAAHRAGEQVARMYKPPRVKQ